MPEIWAVLEHDESGEGSLSENSSELLAELAEIVQRQEDETTLCAVLLGAPEAAPVDMTLFTTLGVQHLYLLGHEELANYSTEGYVSAVAWLIQQWTPVLVAASATANGRDWMPRLAARLHLPFVPGCLGLDLRDDAIFALRAVYEGRAYVHSRTELHGRTGLATFVPGVRGMPDELRKSSKGEMRASAGSFFSKGASEAARNGRLPVPQTGFPQGAPPPPPATPASTGRDINSLPALSMSRFVPEIPGSYGRGRIRRLAIQAPSPEEVELEAAERIVAGGRGVGREGFVSIAAFARLLGAAVGATRVATDRGWIEHARQIGTTGKSVHPRLYIACGISGAAQHTTGMREAQTVVAINPDRTAPIFALADLGLLGDANAILPLAAKMIEQS